MGWVKSEYGVLKAPHAVSEANRNSREAGKPEPERSEGPPKVGVRAERARKFLHLQWYFEKIFYTQDRHKTTTRNRNFFYI